MKRRMVAATASAAAILGLACTEVSAQTSDTSTPGTPPPTAVQGGQPNAPAPAAAPPPSSSQNVGTIETVVVTARRTAENPQDVPVSISAFSADDLQREQINNTQDLQGRVPSLTIGSNSQLRNTETPTIRGQGGTFGASPGVVLYLAEVPVPEDAITNGQGGPGKFFDLADLQVLKGSQGTLFGRNTTGGALLVEPHKPDNRFEASISDEGSTFSGNTAEGVLNVPVIPDKLLLRVGAQFVNRDGFTRDAVTGEDYDSKHYWTTRLGLTWKPAEHIENYLLGYYSHNSDNGTGTVINGINQSGLNYGVLASALQAQGLPLPTQQEADALNVGCEYLDAKAPSTNCGQDIVAAQQARGPRSVQYSTSPNDFLETGAAVDQFKYEISRQLTLRNIASFSFLKHEFRWDFDGSRAALDEVVNPNGVNSTDAQQYTEELQLQGSTLHTRLKYVAGFYYQDQRPSGPQAEDPVALFTALPAETYGVTQRSYAPYAQGTYDLGGLADALDGVKLTGGLRYTTDHVDGFSNAGVGEHSAQFRKSVVTYTAGLDKSIDNTLLYGKVSHGYKAGGFQPTAVNPADYTFKPEYVTNYELGQKSDFTIGNVPARLDTAVYYTSYTDMQRAATDSYLVPGTTTYAYGGAVFTAGKASIGGFEMEGQVQPFTGFNLSLNYAYTYGKYTDFSLQNNGVNPQLDCTGQYVNQGGTVALKCVPFQYTPRHQTSVTARYLVPWEVARGKIDGSVSYAWTDRQYASSYTLPEVEPGAWLGSFGLLNANANWSWLLGEKSSLALRFFGTNLTNRVYRISNSNVWNVAYFQSSIYGEPRIFGVQLAYGWGE